MVPALAARAQRLRGAGGFIPWIFFFFLFASLAFCRASGAWSERAAPRTAGLLGMRHACGRGPSPPGLRQGGDTKLELESCMSFEAEGVGWEWPGRPGAGGPPRHGEARIPGGWAVKSQSPVCPGGGRGEPRLAPPRQATPAPGGSRQGSRGSQLGEAGRAGRAFQSRAYVGRAPRGPCPAPPGAARSADPAPGRAGRAVWRAGGYGGGGSSTLRRQWWSLERAHTRKPTCCCYCYRVRR